MRLALLLFALSSSTFAAFTVTSVAPQSQSLTAEPDGDIVVNFEEPVDPFTVTSATFRVFGRWSGPATGTLSFENFDQTVRFTPDQPLFAGEWVSVMLSHDIVSSFGDSLTTGYYWNFWVRTLPGVLGQPEIAVVQIRQPDEGHIQSYGAYAGDLNDDGWSDLAIPNEQTNDVRIFLNDSGMYGGFTIVQLPGGNTPSPNEGADFNLDGFIDLAVSNIGNNRLSMLFGDGSGMLLPETSYVSGSSVRGVAVIDIDTDGDEDIVTANRFGSNLGIFINDGFGVMAPVVNIDANVNGETAVAVADANNDGIADVFVGGYNSNELSIMLGDGQGNLTFSDKTSIGGSAWMIGVGDLNGDGNVDVASANSLSNNCTAIMCDGAGGFTSLATYPGGTFVLAMDVGDIDGDGDLEMVTSSFSSNDFRVFPNNGDGTFGTAIPYDASSAGSCAILHDRDNDGDLDISAIDELDDLLFIYNNTCCAGTVGNVNDDANEDVTLTDLTLLVNRLFVTFEAVPCFEEADVNTDGQLSLTDLTELVNHLFVTFEPLADCPL